MSLITVNDYKIKEDILDADGKPIVSVVSRRRAVRDTTNLSEIIAYMFIRAEDKPFDELYNHIINQEAGAKTDIKFTR
ncbi:hypothetical protein INT82_10340 [Mannheimia haemolytica]|nr:hypothetical protein [Mannheimia haemolytica]